jgi:outer membrane immunogenic protein
MRKQLFCATATAAIVAALSGPVAAADLRLAPPQRPAVIVPTWAGFYVGGHVGYGRSNHDQRTSNNATNLWDGKKSLSGLAVGFHTGYNWEINRWVLGIEGDASITPWENTQGDNTGVYIRRRLDWLASVRGRLGFTFDRTLIYATGGVAFANASTTENVSHVVALKYNSVGYVVGGGIETKLNPNFSVRLEGLYYGFNKTKSSCAGNGAEGSPVHCQMIDKFKDAAVVRVGASWHFN